MRPVGRTLAGGESEGTAVVFGLLCLVGDVVPVSTAVLAANHATEPYRPCSGHNPSLAVLL